MGWGNPWNVGEDDPNGYAQGPGGKVPAQMMQRQFAGPMQNYAQQLQQQPQYAPQYAQPFTPPPPQFTSPQDAAAWCAQFPNHPQAPSIMQQIARMMAGGFGVRQQIDGPFSAEMFYKSMPSKVRSEPLPLSPALAVAAAASATMSVTIQKPFKGRKLTLSAAAASFVITSITAAGTTMTAASGTIPASRYSLVDSFDNLAFPALTSGATIVLQVTNVSAVVADLYGVIDGETGEA